MFLALSDPRFVPETGRASIRVVKIAAFFFEAPRPDGTVGGRFLRVQAPSIPCDCNCQSAGTFLRDCR